MKKVVFLFLSLMLAVTVGAQDLKGKWNFNAEGAPDGYDRGTIEFKEVKKQPVAKIAFPYNSFEVKLQKKDATTYKCNLYVEGTDVYVTITSKDGKLKGSAEADGMQINVTFTTPKKSKKI